MLKRSETRTGNHTSFFVGHSAKVGHLLITVLDSTLELDLEGGLTPAKQKLILDWFEPLAEANKSALH